MADAGFYDPQTAKYILDTVNEFHRLRQSRDGEFRESTRRPMTFIKIPESGIAAATSSGSVPSKTTGCVVYRNTGTDGTLEVQQLNGVDYTVDVFHYGAAIDTRASHSYEYMQIIRTHVGWVISVEYCD